MEQFTAEEVAVIKKVVAGKLKAEAEAVKAEAKAKKVAQYEAERKVIFDKADKEATELQIAWGEKLK